MLRQKQEKSGTGICHVMQGKESKTCPSDSPDGQEVNVYTIDGLSLGTATVKNGEALISTSIPSGDIAVVKVGGRSVKVIMR